MDPASEDSFRRVDAALGKLNATLSSFKLSATRLPKHHDISNGENSQHNPVSTTSNLPTAPSHPPNPPPSKAPTPGPTDVLTTLIELNRLILARPYRICHRFLRARCYNILGFPDLAAGEAYKILLILDETGDEAGEHHDAALSDMQGWVQNDKPQTDAGARESIEGLKLVEVILDELDDCPSDDEEEDGEGDEDEGSLSEGDGGVAEAVNASFFETVKRLCYVAAYRMLVRALWTCGCWKSAVEFVRRGRRQLPDEFGLRRDEARMRRCWTEDRVKRGLVLCPEATWDLSSLPDHGSVRREIYPWTLPQKDNTEQVHQFQQDPDRLSKDALVRINTEMNRVAPKLEVRVVELSLLHPDPATKGLEKMKQLGVFAKEDLAPNEVILEEHTLYTANSRSHEAFCDACCAPLPEIESIAPNVPSEASTAAIVPCPDCEDVLFCSQACLELAQTQYHPAICGRDMESLCKNVPAAETSDAMYTLLLLRTLAMAETQNKHPLNLRLMQFVCGDFTNPSSSSASASPSYLPTPTPTPHDLFHTSPRTLPFSFTANVLTPLHILTKMDVNIFAAEHRYDTWVFNTLYAKLRATASARMAPDGRPEVAALHPLWCLANHSCDPNVSWEWGGGIAFRVRERRGRWAVRGGGGGAEGERGAGGGKEVLLREERKGGIKRGEEILNHYCDVELPVKERREWASGALGGMCMCARCVVEAVAEGAE